MVFYASVFASLNSSSLERAELSRALQTSSLFLTLPRTVRLCYHLGSGAPLGSEVGWMRYRAEGQRRIGGAVGPFVPGGCGGQQFCGTLFLGVFSGVWVLGPRPGQQCL